jgi:uncharacterized protein
VNQAAEINVTATATSSAMPDGMQIDLSVVSQRSDYPQTLKDLNARVAAICHAFSLAGISDAVVTKSYAISEVWSDQYDDDKRKFQGYKAAQKMMVTIPVDHALLGRVIEELASSDSKPGLSISFVIRSSAQMERDARIAAVANAKEAANDLAQAAGLQLSGVKSITFTARGSSSGTDVLRMDALVQYDISPSAPVTPDVINHDETVHIVWLASPTV